MDFAVILVMGLLWVASAIHIYWALGGQRWVEKAIPTTQEGRELFQPSAFATWLVAIGLLGVAALVYGMYFSNSLSPAIKGYLTYLVWAVSAAFILRAIGDFKWVGLFKKVKNTEFAINDSRYYSPLILFIGVVLLIMTV